jgi:hypothetical protein
MNKLSANKLSMNKLSSGLNNDSKSGNGSKRICPVG